MDYSIIGGVILNNEQIDKYLDSLINKIFAILGIYEDCEKINNFKNYLSYVNIIIIEVKGFYKFSNAENFLSLISILNGMTLLDEMKHGTVKSLTFHCISIIKKVKVK